MNPLTLLLVVEQALIPSIQPALDTYVESRMDAGWTVGLIQAPSNSTNYIANTAWIRSNIWPLLNTNTTVFLVGNVPRPRSGLYLSPDGHGNVGCYSAIGYWVTPGEWTDVWANGYKGSFANSAQDGKFDNGTFPSNPISGLGLLNFSTANLDNAFYINRYFAKLNDYYASKWQVVPRAQYAYDATTTTYANAPYTVKRLANVFGGAIQYRAPWNKASTNPPAVEVLAVKTSDYATVLKRSTYPKSVAYLAWNSGQYELSSYPNTKDIFYALANTNGPLVIALNHPQYTFNLQNNTTYGDMWKTTYTNGTPTFGWLLGDPTLKLAIKPAIDN